MPHNEPEATPEDTNPQPSPSLEERLRAEEPPLHEEDTSPSRSVPLHERLAAEEPLVSDEDTTPSRAAQTLLSDEWPPPAARPQGRLARILQGLMVLGTLALVALAAYVWLSPEGTPTTPIVVATAATDPPTLSAATATLRPTAAPASSSQNGLTLAAAMPLFPTAAAEEIEAALLAPVPADPVSEAFLRESAPFTIRPVTARASVVQYTVQEGDTLESIAEKFGLKDYYTLIWSNKTNKYNPLRAGNTLNILPEDGVYHEVTEPIRIADLAEMYEVDPYAIIDSEYNDLLGSTPETSLVKGMWVVVPGGKATRELFLEQPTFVGTFDGGVLSGTYTLWGCTADITGGSPPWSRRPLDNYKWVQGFVPGGHTGVDLSANTGEPVYAAGAGTVVFAGWNDTGYGNVVVIAHGTTFSLYGHLSRTLVRCNQQVGIGDLIGRVGNTGNSSGPHLHFEIRDTNWNAQNPLNYIGF